MPKAQPDRDAAIRADRRDGMTREALAEKWQLSVNSIWRICKDQERRKSGRTRENPEPHVSDIARSFLYAPRARIEV